jgi:hypothetical protein
MKFNQEALLVGVIGKKGAGTLDNGQAWATDRVELHVLSAFPDSDTMAHGQTVTSYAVDNFAANYEKAKSMIDQRIILQMEMIPAKKLGQQPRFVCLDFQVVGHIAKRPSIPQAVSA